MDAERIRNYLMYAFVGLLPLQTVYLLREIFIKGEKWQYGTIAIYGTDILLVLLLGLWIVYFFKERSKKQGARNWDRGLLLLGLFVCWAGISVAWAPDRILAGYFFVKLSLAAGLFLVVRSLGERSVRGLIAALIIGAVLESMIGVWQFLAQSTFASTWLGMSMHEAGLAGTSVLKLGGDGRWLRAYGTLPHPNMLGGFLSAVLVIGIGYLARFGSASLRTVLMSRTALRESGASLRDRFMDTVRMSGITLAGAMLLLGLLLTFSRSAWLGAAIGIVVYGVWSIKHHVWGGQLLRVLGVLAVVLVVFTSVLYEQIFPRFDSTVIAAEGSVSERVQSIRDAERVIGEGNLLLGTGAGNFTAAMMRLEPGRPVWSVQPAHNVPMLVFSELGLIGCILLFASLLSIAASIRWKDHIIPVCALLSLLPSLLLDHWLWTSHFGLYFFFLLFGLAVRKY